MILICTFLITDETDYTVFLNCHLNLCFSKIPTYVIFLLEVIFLHSNLYILYTIHSFVTCIVSFLQFEGYFSLFFFFSSLILIKGIYLFLVVLIGVLGFMVCCLVNFGKFFALIFLSNSILPSFSLGLQLHC